MTLTRNISAVIITYNEAHNIAACIKSVAEIVDEVIVVDANSKDNTVSIAKILGAKVFVNDWISYGNQKNFGMEQTQTDWILSIDADERPDDKLRETIKEINLQQDKIYALNVKTNYLGRWIRYCGWYPSYKNRLYNKHCARWNDELVHEKLIFEEKFKVERLPGNLLHYSYPNIEYHHQKIKKYAKLTAKKWKLQNKHPGVFKKLFGPSFRFFKTYIIRLGILDGREGFMISKMSYLLVKEQLKYYKQLDYRR